MSSTATKSAAATTGSARCTRLLRKWNQREPMSQTELGTHMRVSRDIRTSSAGDGRSGAMGVRAWYPNLHQDARDGSHLQRGGRGNTGSTRPSASHTHNGRTYAGKAEMLYAQQLEVNRRSGVCRAAARNWGRTRRLQAGLCNHREGP